MEKEKWQNVFIDWGKNQGRNHLPWQYSGAYETWVSEIMLQQTQVETVLKYYAEFLKAFPDVKSLAKASQDDVMAKWAGLGYYRRARFLHKGAQWIVDQRQGKMPKSAQEWQEVPGVGKTTAHAISAFVSKEKKAIFDGNVARWTSRFWAEESPINQEKTKQMLWNKLQAEMDEIQEEDVVVWTQTSMDLGAIICTPKNPKCNQCPLMQKCLAHKNGSVNQIPKKNKITKERRHEEQTVSLDYNIKNGEVWVRMFKNHANQGVWQDLWIFPLKKAKNEDASWMQIEHSFSHYDLTLSVHLKKHQSMGVKENFEWMTLKKALESAIPSPINQALQKLKRDLGIDNE